jgi:hypothetical protein
MVIGFGDRYDLKKKYWEDWRQVLWSVNNLTMVCGEKKLQYE